MPDFRFFFPITVRYADLDTQRHVNQAMYFIYMQEARSGYLQRLGLWAGKDFDAVGIIMAEQSCIYKVPITFGQRIHVGVRVIRMGDKSLEMEYTFRDQEDGKEFAAGKSVLVSYDYRKNQSRTVPDSWREAIRTFEGMV